MIEYATLSSLYTSFIVRLVRFFLLFVLAVLALSDIANGVIPRMSLFFLLVLFMTHTFFVFKIGKTKPKHTVSENLHNIYDSFTLKSVELFIRNGKTEKIIRSLLKQASIQFMIQKIDVTKENIQLLDISKEDLSTYAFHLTQKQGYTFVTPMDIFTSYLLLTEHETHLLLNASLNENDLLHILRWVRNDFPDIEQPKKFRIQFWGEGVGEYWVYGWTLEMKKYTVDLTSRMLNKRPLLLGRDKEYKVAIEAFSKQEKNSIILVGAPGSGKQTFVEKLAMDSFSGTIKGPLYHKRFFELLLSSLLAGTQNQGDLEERLVAIIEELLHAGNIILYIPQITNYLSSSNFHVNLLAVPLPYIRSGKIRIVGTATEEEFKTYIQPDHSLFEIFEIIELTEPSEQEALHMLLEKADDIERGNKIVLSYKSLVAAVRLAHDYLRENVLPGSAVSLLQDAAVHAISLKQKEVTADDVIKKVEEKTKIAINRPETQEKATLMKMEEKLHARVIGQNDAIEAISSAIRRLRSGVTRQTKPISFLFLGPTGVGKTETAKALSDLYFGSEQTMVRLDMSEYQTEEGAKRLLGALPGEGSEKGELTDKVYDHPFSLILLDEFEKANPRVLDLFLQVLDDGRLTDNKGRTVSFKNTIIIATSNAASEFVREELQKDTVIDSAFSQKLLNFLQTKGIFKPELLNRFDDCIVYKALTQEEIQKIVKLLLRNVALQLKEQEITLVFDDAVVEKIAREGFDKDFGARPIRRYIQNSLENIIAQKLLQDELKRGESARVSLGIDGTIEIIKTS